MLPLLPELDFRTVLPLPAELDFRKALPLLPELDFRKALPLLPQPDNLRFGRCRLSYVLFGGLFLLLYLRRLLNLFHFIFVNHSTHSSYETKN